jgi:oxygen-independent coproporphyrinogen-3 oxidase
MIYLHIPFCKSFCAYCDFYSEVCPANESARAQKLYADGVCAEMDARREEIRAAGVPKTLYIGGGTPSVLDIGELERIVGHLDAGPYEEFTVEVNPEDIVEKGPGYVRGLQEIGVNRISMGVQSLDDGILRWMNRRHDATHARQAFRILREAGVENLSIDLIFGLSQLSETILAQTLDEVLEWRPEHISAYQLSIEEGSALGRLVREGSYTEAPQEQCASQYTLLCKRLREAGYVHYEISNWALPGREAIHNSAYWTRHPYVGLGPGAHSFDGRVRSWNEESVPEYTPGGREMLSEAEAREEQIFLGLRTARGIPETWLETDAAAEALADGRLVRLPEGRVRIPEDHLFVSDDLLAILI